MERKKIECDAVKTICSTCRQPGWPSATQLIDEVMVPVARELQLPLALKLGAMRGMNPELDPCGGGDGVVVADVTPLRLLCAGNPDLKFLATFLSRVNQHEVCRVVLSINVDINGVVFQLCEEHTFTDTETPPSFF